MLKEYKDQLEVSINEFVRGYKEEKATICNWKEPLITYAWSEDPIFLELKKIVDPQHQLPKDFMDNPKTVIAYFIPFDEVVVKSNVGGRFSSELWGISYIETNQLIRDLNEFINKELKMLGYNSSIIPATHNFDEEKLVSHWSHRHVGYIAGLGTFGVNRMLITSKGCCGRIGSIVTDLEIPPTIRGEGENCLYKANGSCLTCVKSCVMDALSPDSFNRFKCYEMCLENADNLKDIGLADVCGKCVVNQPCSTKIPTQRNFSDNSTSTE
ncbi:epoxyqueuosine reductase [Alkaliphilus serpentinus]|uniref:Epoxyqueuosine reductase n=1 Tax=Alkaliphilus serpentinus TaxID=1482731 RepID=A0A833M8M7_9FIRM|nr:epoxyqueuosine reductase [Alkaliphilus serpentinus]KAB3531396.1 epoxyqueuosine reductase [Alkaliphilus serpentinus]